MAKRSSGRAAKRAGTKRAAAGRTPMKRAAKRPTAKRKAARRTTAKKKTAARRATAKRKTPAKRATTTPARGPAKKKTARRGPAKTRTAKRKTAARAAASRSTRRGNPETPPSTLNAAATAVRGAMAGAVSAVSERLPWTTSEPDALTILETDHRRLEDLLKQGEDTTERAVKGRTDLLNTLTRELNLHELIEEKVLYPALKAHAQAREIVLEGYQEHHVADLIVKELHGLERDNEQWGAKFKVLKENIEHHIKEEEGQMFRTARAVMSREDLRALGARMAAMKASHSPGS